MLFIAVWPICIAASVKAANQLMSSSLLQVIAQNKSESMLKDGNILKCIVCHVIAYSVFQLHQQKIHVNTCAILHIHDILYLTC